MASNMNRSGIVIRKSEERGHADHGWLNSYHTFSFAGYHDRRFESFGALRVLNEDRVEPGQGFPPHPHREYEIFSYVVNGFLSHKDSMGNAEVITRGGIQFTSAGKGITHSEYNHSKPQSRKYQSKYIGRNNSDEEEDSMYGDHSTKLATGKKEPLPQVEDGKEVHFLQLWCTPSKRGLNPSYQTRQFTDEQKRNTLCQLISPKESPVKSTITIHQDLSMYASILDKDSEVSFQFTSPDRRGYVHVPMTNQGGSITVNGVELKEGDGAFITGQEAITFVGKGEKPTEFVFLEMA